MELVVGMSAVINGAGRYSSYALGRVVSIGKRTVDVEVFGRDGEAIKTRKFMISSGYEFGQGDASFPASVFFPQTYSNPCSPEQFMERYTAGLQAATIIQNNKKLIRDFVALMGAGKISNESIDAVSTAAALAIIKYSEGKAS